MRRALLALGLVALAACSSSTSSSTTNGGVSHATGEAGPTSGGSGTVEPRTVKVQFDGQAYTFDVQQCAGAATGFAVQASKGTGQVFQVGVGADEGDPTKGGTFHKFALQMTAGTVNVAAASGTLTVDSDLKRGDFTAKDAISGKDLTGAFAC